MVWSGEFKIMSCEKCQDTGWKRVVIDGVERVTVCDCQVRARAEEAKAHPGGFTPVGEINQKSEITLRQSSASLSEVEGRNRNPDGVAYAAARVALLSKPEREIGMVILDHRGRGQAIKIDDLRAMFPELDARRVKQAVETLRVVARVPIAATKEPPYGYFIPETAEECDEMYRRHVRELVAHARVARLFRPDADLVRELSGQLRIMNGEL